MALDSLLRQQAAIGLFDPWPDDIEVEIAHRTLMLRTGEAALPQLAIGQEDRFLRGLPIAEGGLILLLTGAGDLPGQPVKAPEPAAAEVGAPVTAPVEW